jgi:peptidoglycan/xylan/chitin deacetylase (PgdA/CDA1 family)
MVFLLLAAAALGLVAAHVLPRNRTLAVIGGFVAVTAAWLAPQRDDLAALAICAFLFALGLGAVFDPWRFPWPSGPAGKPTRGRAIAYGSALVATTLIFTAYIGAETPGSTWFGGGAVHGPTSTGEVALTFDDGPNIGATRKIMQILDAHGVKGTFFEVGKAIDAQPQITRALYDDGQLLGNHSYNHDQWRLLDPGYPELQRTQAAFRRAIGTCPVLYRPPHGDRTPFLANVVRDHHMRMVLWSASAGDWATDDAHLVARRILDQAKPGAILLLHDGLDGIPTADRTVLVQALPIILDGLRAKGLAPVRLDKLLGTAAYQRC